MLGNLAIRKSPRSTGKARREGWSRQASISGLAKRPDVTRAHADLTTRCDLRLVSRETVFAPGRGDRRCQLAPKLPESCLPKVKEKRGRDLNRDDPGDRLR